MGIPQDPRRAGRPGVNLAVPTVGQIIRTNGTGPRRGGPGRPGHCSCAPRPGAILVCDFFSVDLPGGTRAPMS